jgi:hypothetical protein
MEAVEVVDPAARQVVDELRLSTAARRVRILGLSPYPDGCALILRVVAVGMDIDRFEAEDAEYVVYDLNAHQVKESFRLPPEVRTNFTAPLPFSSAADVLPSSRDITSFRLTHELSPDRARDTAEAGYSLRRANLYSPAPGIYYGLVTSTDPFLKKQMTAVLRLDLVQRVAASFEVGPKVDADIFALSPDGKTGYAGVKDLVKIDMESHRIVAMKKGFLQGRAATTLIVSADGTKLFVTGVGDEIRVVYAESLEWKRTIQLGRDLMANPLPLPAGMGAMSERFDEPVTDSERAFPWETRVRIDSSYGEQVEARDSVVARGWSCDRRRIERQSGSGEFCAANINGELQEVSHSTRCFLRSLVEWDACDSLGSFSRYARVPIEQSFWKNGSNGQW